jgi:putative transposase
MILVHLDEAARDELKSLRRTDLPPRARDRLEMVLLSSVAWAPARIASHLGYCTATVRCVLKDFQARGVDSLSPKRTGPPPDRGRRESVEGLLGECLGEARTWTSRQLAAALAGRGMALSARQVRRYLTGMGAGWRRTADSLRHKQDPATAERARAVLDNLKKKRPPAA